VKSHEPWLQHFATLAGQECGVHCYEHRPFAQYDEIHRDLGKAKRLMEGVGLRPEGVTAPYGTWSDRFARAAEDLGFGYSSEFSLAYDSLPFTPGYKGKRFTTLQVPIHPVCVGSLLRAGYSEEGMCEYFERVIREKLARHEPVFLYHHPSHRNWRVIRYICSRMEEEGVPSTTLGEYATWWKRRTERSFSASLEGTRLRTRVAEGAGGAEEVLIRVTRPGGEEALIAAAPEVDLQGVAWNTTLPYLPPEDIRRIREFDPRSVLGVMYSSFLRRRR
jgi:hypothetical protein